jgi:hypothetical protein
MLPPAPTSPHPGALPLAAATTRVPLIPRAAVLTACLDKHVCRVLVTAVTCRCRTPFKKCSAQCWHLCRRRGTFPRSPRSMQLSAKARLQGHRARPGWVPFQARLSSSPSAAVRGFRVSMIKNVFMV